jgi:hypothetical protein
MRLPGLLEYSPRISIGKAIARIVRAAKPSTG